MRNDPNIADQRFRPVQRVRRGSDFDRVYRLRTSVADGVLIVYGGPNEIPWPRIGLSVGRRVGNAVIRNRWKRLIREAFRLNASRLPAGIDFIVHPRPGVQPRLDEVSRSLVHLAARVSRKLGAHPR